MIWAAVSPPFGNERNPVQAEGVGFEPTVTTKGHSGFRDRPDRPLRHPSGGSNYSGFLTPPPPPAAAAAKPLGEG
jgi:hypothetical protein